MTTTLSLENHALLLLILKEKKNLKKLLLLLKISMETKSTKKDINSFMKSMDLNSTN